jgi:hypothetical protein
MTGPRLDEYLLQSGEHVEDLSRIAAAQQYRPTGPVLSPRGLGLWAEAGRRPVRTRRLTSQESEQWEHLCEAELAAADGTLTPHGRDLLDQLQHHSHQVRVEATNGQETFSFVALGQGARFVTLATAAPHPAEGRLTPREVAATAHTLTLGVHHRSMLPVALASWLGLGPAWSLSATPDELDTQLVEARIADPGAPPPAAADANLREVWGQPWFAWTLTTTPAQRGMAMIHTADRGQLTLTAATTPGLTRLVAVPSQLVWLEVVRAVTQRD